jgi:hypothetical protein
MAATTTATMEAPPSMPNGSAAVIEDRMVPAAVMLFVWMVDDKVRRIAPATPVRCISISGVAVAVPAIVGTASDRGAGDDAEQNKCCDRADRDEGSLW